ncbi:angiotensin-converting enzyme-like isoform X2 [Aricia agestis]|uniref:angiotensin-converting enzyme-like isoform X2 n=1 Tax=Aricia agestis TaxID=91739 RepID=UPI001C206B0E|nr:angiotensin-converting enzyme-like isoform X2 [Aricia agestis]
MNGLLWFRMEYQILFYTILLLKYVNTVHYPTDPTSEMIPDNKNVVLRSNPEELRSDEEFEYGRDSDQEKNSVTESEDKRFLDEALNVINNPFTVLASNQDTIENYKGALENIKHENITLEDFFIQMDKLSLDVCKSSQKSLWSYVLNTNDELAKDNMLSISAEEDDLKIEYWNLIKEKYLQETQSINDTKLNRKLRMIQVKAINHEILRSKDPNRIDAMHRIWSQAIVCSDDSIVCTKETARTLNDIITIFKTSNDSDELKHYWKGYRDATGMKIRPIFQDYLSEANTVAASENFSDAGEIWRYTHEDDNFTETVERIWSEVKPLYQTLHKYVRAKLKTDYNDDFTNDELIPAHLLGNLWAQEWQGIFSKVMLFPNTSKPIIANNNNESIDSKVLFDVVDDFHISLGFESTIDSYEGVTDTTDCISSSHDLCDGVHYRIRWCENNVTDLMEDLTKAGRLMSHIQYFKHYRNLELIFRDGPTPAFHNTFADFFTLQITAPQHLKTLSFVEIDSDNETSLNHLLWLALQKLPMIAYSYILDKWRWDIFANDTMRNWNQHWWDLRTNEMGLSPPVFRNEKDLDPASKYHVVSHVQYITYFISHVLEFQMLLSLCKRANHTGPLHECSIRGNKEAGKLLSDGMSLGASEDWRTVLETITGEREFSTEGIFKFFEPLKEILEAETAKLENAGIQENKASIIIGIVIACLVVVILLLYLLKKTDARNKVLALCGLKQNASLDIVTFEANGATNNGITEIKG